MKINKKVISLQAKNPRILGRPNKKETNEKYFGLVKMLQQCRHEEAEDNLNEENLIDTPEPNPLLQIAVENFTTMVEENLSEAMEIFTTMVKENLSEASLLFTGMVEENLSEAILLFTAITIPVNEKPNPLLQIAVEIVAFLLNEKQADTLFLMPVTALVNILVEMVLQGRQKEAANILVEWNQNGGLTAQKAWDIFTTIKTENLRAANSILTAITTLVKPPRQTNRIVAQEEPSSTSRMTNKKKIIRLFGFRR
ncbi:hypothetical protein HN511_07040 [bacterium]|nr:hypothetical protein [bacterium]